MLRSSSLPPGCPSPWLTAGRHRKTEKRLNTVGSVVSPQQAPKPVMYRVRRVKDRDIIYMASELNSKEQCQNSVRSPLISQSKTCLEKAVRQCNPIAPTQNPINCLAFLSLLQLITSLSLPQLIAALSHSVPLSLSLLQFGPSMSDCLQPVAFTSLLMEPSGRLIQFSSWTGWVGYGRVTQLHISQLGPLSVCSAPLLGNQGGHRREEAAEEAKRKK